jgi:hypothetical protein
MFCFQTPETYTHDIVSLRDSRPSLSCRRMAFAWSWSHLPHRCHGDCASVGLGGGVACAGVG